MDDFRCCPTTRRSLAERIKDIISTYERSFTSSCQPTCPSSLKKPSISSRISCPVNQIASPTTLTFRTSCKRPQCPGRPSSACDPCDRPMCSPRSTSSCNPCLKTAITCPAYLSRPSSSCEVSGRRKRSSPITCTDLNLPPVCPGPNLQRYLSSKGICPSLVGRLSLYEAKGSSLCSPCSRNTKPTSPGSCRRIIRCPETSKDQICRPVCPSTIRKSRLIGPSSSCLCNDLTPNSGLMQTFRSLEPTSHCSPRSICPALLPPRSSWNSCGARPGSGLSTCGPKFINSMADPPFSSPTLEREFTSRFVKVQICSCRSSGSVTDSPRIMDFDSCRC